MSAILTIEPLGFPWRTQDPFLFCAYHRDEYPEGNGSMGVKSEQLVGRQIGSDFTIKNGFRMYHGSQIPGFPYHPHRGFETITINKEGVVDHSDSLGAAGRFMAGDVQWMTAGAGVQHSEMFPMIHDDKPNHLEIFQVWLNLPAVSKMVPAHFKMLWKEDVPVLNHKDERGNGTQVEVVAGSLYGVKAVDPAPNSWAANPDNAVGVYTVKMDSEASWKLPATHSKATRSLFFYSGSELSINGEAVPANSLVEAKTGEDLQIVNSNAEARLLILEGVPMNEPVVQHGPFVMNTHEEIRETMKEYGRTQFGGWPWGEKEMVHPKEKGRFALHSDGREEVKG